MNPTLLHNSYTLSYPFSQSDRHYTNGSLATDEYLGRRNDISADPLNQSMSMGGSGPGMGYSSNQIQHDNPPCNATNSQLILTPPQSGDESSSTVTNPSSSSFTYSSLPKVSVSNAQGSTYYSTTAPLPLQSTSYGSTMTDFVRPSRPMHMPPLSPPYTFGPLMGSYPPNSMTRPSMYAGESYPGRPGPVFTPNSYPFERPRFPLASPFTNMVSQGPPPASRPEGPPFEDTQKLNTLVNARGQSLGVDIIASIPKGFFRVEDKWTCYRRNYFSVSCGFTFKTATLDGQVYLQRYSSQHEAVSGYAVSISARTAAGNNNAESELRGLVQHTPKRDKATETVPGRHMVVPTPAHSLSGTHTLPNNGLYPSAPQFSGCLSNGLDPFGQSASQSPQTNYTFERIQFQKATANNGKRRAQQQYFHVVVKLEVNVGRTGGPEEWVAVAQKQSHPMVVRGRSPGHYKDNRRDSQTSMDPDGNTGHSGDSGSGGFTLHPFGHNHTTSMGSTPSQYRHGHSHHSTYSNHRIEESDSSSSPGSSEILASSPTKGDSYHLPRGVTRSMAADGTFERVVLSPILNKTSSDRIEYHHVKKRCYDDDSSDCPTGFFQSSLDNSYHTPSFDFSATSASQALCASS